MKLSPITNIPVKSSYDVVIIGGAMLGSSLSWFLSQNSDFDGAVLVVERDHSYEYAATSRTNSCVRQQFSRELNVKISQFAADYIRNFRGYMGNDDRVPEVFFNSFGYMYLSNTEEFSELLRQNQKIQEACGAGTKIMSGAEIARDYPFYKTDDILVGSHNLIDEGYFDGNTLFEWWKRTARESGVEYLDNEVVAIQKNKAGDKVESITLKTGEEIMCGTLINAAGTRSVEIAKILDIDIPIEPRKRYTYIFAAQNPLDRDLPLTIDPSGVHFRTDGLYYMAGGSPENDQRVDYDDFEEDHDLWEQKIWPAIANRIPQFEAIKVINSWVGHYDFNVFDQNAILGPHPEIQNFSFLTGFSGHGFQQSPAMGRAMAELITYGNYRSLDLSPFHYDRIVHNKPFLETAVI